MMDIQLQLPDGVKIYAPDSLENLTSYIIREQGDYFEDELRFARKLIRPGESAVDIGANYGAYTLSIAKCVGPSGHVIAFEPARETVATLRKSIAANGYSQVTLVDAAVSDQANGANLSIGKHAELNSLSIQGNTPNTECVRTVTLDSFFDGQTWNRCDFIKIDAEGSEPRILSGAPRFFRDFSPLVQFEIRTQASCVNWDLVDQFRDIGYMPYRLVPGLGVLMPVDPRSSIDPYLLNLFCCKADKAQQLATRQLLIQSLVSPPPPGAEPSMPTVSEEWLHTLGNPLYADAFRGIWSSHSGASDSPTNERILGLFALSRDDRLSPTHRLACLQQSYLASRAICDTNPRALRLATHARVASEFGERAIALAALHQLLAVVHRTGVDFREPFLPPLKAFDQIAPDKTPERWLIASILEFLERQECFSSFYSGRSALGRLIDIAGLGLGGAEMERRLDLIRRRFAALA